MSESHPKSPVDPASNGINPKANPAHEQHEAQYYFPVPSDIKPAKKHSRERRECRPDQTHWAKVLLEVAGVAFVAAYSYVAYRQLGTMNQTYGEIQTQTTNALDASRRQFSPYILYDSSRIDVSKDGRRYRVSIQLKNVGQTPAYSVRHWATAKDMPRLADPYKHFSPPAPVGFLEPTFDGIADIGGGQSICLQGEFTVNGKSSNAIYVWGDLRYWDDFKRCEFDAFVLQSTGNIASGKLASVFNWASDITNPRGKCNDRQIAKLPWPEDSAPNRVIHAFSVFQGDCPK